MFERREENEETILTTTSSSSSSSPPKPVVLKRVFASSILAGLHFTVSLCAFDVSFDYLSFLFN